MGLAWTIKELRLAIQMEVQGRDAEFIAKRLGGRHTPDEVAPAVAKYREQRAIDRKRYAENYKFNPFKIFGPAPPPVVVPEAVWQERDRRICAPVRDLTAALMGDPPQGFSALERRA